MADGEKKQEEGKKKSPVVMTIAAVALVSVAAAGGGWFLGNMLGTSQKADEAAKARDALEHQKKLADEVDLHISTENNGIVVLEPVTANLAFPSDNWIRLEVALQFRDTPDIDTSEAVHQDIMAYLRTVSLQQIQGPRGFEHLREDLVERAVLRSKGRVQNLLLRTFVIE